MDYRATEDVGKCTVGREYGTYSLLFVRSVALRRPKLAPPHPLETRTAQEQLFLTLTPFSVLIFGQKW